MLRPLLTKKLPYHDVLLTHFHVPISVVICSSFLLCDGPIVAQRDPSLLQFIDCLGPEEEEIAVRCLCCSDRLDGVITDLINMASDSRTLAVGVGNALTGHCAEVLDVLNSLSHSAVEVGHGKGATSDCLNVIIEASEKDRRIEWLPV